MVPCEEQKLTCCWNWEGKGSTGKTQENVCHESEQKLLGWHTAWRDDGMFLVEGEQARNKKGVSKKVKHEVDSGGSTGGCWAWCRLRGRTFHTE
jgi:hypothetical protein